MPLCCVYSFAIKRTRTWREISCKSRVARAVQQQQHTAQCSLEYASYVSGVVCLCVYRFYIYNFSVCVCVSNCGNNCAWSLPRCVPILWARDTDTTQHSPQKSNEKIESSLPHIYIFIYYNFLHPRPRQTQDHIIFSTTHSGAVACALLAHTKQQQKLIARCCAHKRCLIICHFMALCALCVGAVSGCLIDCNNGPRLHGAWNDALWRRVRTLCWCFFLLFLQSLGV